MLQLLHALRRCDIVLRIRETKSENIVGLAYIVVCYSANRRTCAQKMKQCLVRRTMNCLESNCIVNN